MNDIFYDGHDELYHHAKFGEDSTIRAGCMCENVVFVLLLFINLENRKPVLLYYPYQELKEM